MLEAKRLAQGRKGTGELKRQIGVRCPLDLYEWIEAGRGPRDTDTDRVLAALELVRDFEDTAGARLQELRAMAVLEHVTMGRLLGRLSVEALDAKQKKGSRK